MANPLIIGGLVIGGAVAAWRIVRRERARLRSIAEKIALAGERRQPAPVRLEKDPETGVYRPAGEQRRPRA